MAGFAMSFNGSLATMTATVGGLDKTMVQAGCYALNHTVAKARTAVGRELASVTGLSYGKASAEVKQYSASPGRPEAELKATGGYHKLSEFGARQSSAGVTASPWGVRRTFPHTFIIAKFGGGVFARKPGNLGGSLQGRFPIRQLYGPAIPKEMMKDPTVRVWDATLASELPIRMAHELARLL